MTFYNEEFISILQQNYTFNPKTRVVSVHIRRGDFLKSGNKGVLTANYYLQGWHMLRCVRTGAGAYGFLILCRFLPPNLSMFRPSCCACPGCFPLPNTYTGRGCARVTLLQSMIWLWLFLLKRKALTGQGNVCVFHVQQPQWCSILKAHTGGPKPCMWTCLPSPSVCTTFATREAF